MHSLESTIAAELDALIDMIRMRDQSLLDALWGEGGFVLVGSEVGEICRTRSELAAKIAAIFAHPSTFIFDFPRRTVRIAGSVAWVVAEGTLARRETDGTEQSRPYIACCIFELVDGVGAGDSSSARSPTDNLQIRGTYLVLRPLMLDQPHGRLSSRVRGGCSIRATWARGRSPVCSGTEPAATETLLGRRPLTMRDVLTRRLISA